MLFGEETISEMLTGLEINTKAIDQHLQLTERTVWSDYHDVWTILINDITVHWPI